MRAIRRWDPLSELSTLHKEMDEFFKKTFGGVALGHVKGAPYPTIECFTKEGNVVVKADLPGMDAKDIEVSVTGNLLTVKGERKTEKTEKEGEHFYSETSYGAFERTITLPEGVNADKARASFKNGVLELTMPVKAEALPRKVAVEVEGEKAGKKAA